MFVAASNPANFYSIERARLQVRIAELEIKAKLITGCPTTMKVITSHIEFY